MKSGSGRARRLAITVALGVWASLLIGGCASGPPVAAAARHPDFSGVWTWDLAPGQSPFRRPRLHLPLTPLGRRKVNDYQALVRPTSDHPGAHCLGSGMPADMMFSGGYPMEIVQTPDLIVVLYEAWSEVRQVYLGEKIIPRYDRLPDREGYSAAHWKGATLVVLTDALKEQEDQTYPHSAKARIVERYQLTRDARGRRVLVDDWTMTDPLFYTRPIHFEKKWAYAPKGILLPYECNEEGWLEHLDALRKARSAAVAAAGKPHP